MLLLFLVNRSEVVLDVVDRRIGGGGDFTSTSSSRKGFAILARVTSHENILTTCVQAGIYFPILMVI